MKINLEMLLLISAHSTRNKQPVAAGVKYQKTVLCLPIPSVTLPWTEYMELFNNLFPHYSLSFHSHLCTNISVSAADQLLPCAGGCPPFWHSSPLQTPFPTKQLAHTNYTEDFPVYHTLQLLFDAIMIYIH